MFANTDWYLYNFRLGTGTGACANVATKWCWSPRMVHMALGCRRWVSAGLPFPLARRSLNPFSELWTIFRLLRLYRQEKPDLVHHFTVKCVLYGSLVCRILGIRSVVNSVTGLGYVFMEGEGRALVARLDQVFLSVDFVAYLGHLSKSG